MFLFFLLLQFLSYLQCNWMSKTHIWYSRANILTNQSAIKVHSTMHITYWFRRSFSDFVLDNAVPLFTCSLAFRNCRCVCFHGNYEKVSTMWLLQYLRESRLAVRQNISKPMQIIVFVQQLYLPQYIKGSKLNYHNPETTMYFYGNKRCIVYCIISLCSMMKAPSAMISAQLFSDNRL